MEDFFVQFWNLVLTFINPLNLRHPEVYTEALRAGGAMWPSVVATNLIVFAETGLLIGFLLPGDSMLVVLGIFIRAAEWPVLLFLVTLCVSAVVGDSFGYWIGKKAGPAIFKRPDGRFFRQSHLQTAKAYYEKHGGKTIIIARFIPIVRTFVPVVAGAAKMEYRTFLFYNVIGGISWIVSMLLLGYYIEPVVQQFLPGFQIAKHIDKVIIVVVALSVLPIIIKAWKAGRAKKAVPVAPPADGGTMTAESPKP